MSTSENRQSFNLAKVSRYTVYNMDTNTNHFTAARAACVG